MDNIFTEQLRVDVSVNSPASICPHVCEAILAEVPQVDDISGDTCQVTFLWEDGTEYNPNRLETLKLRLQKVIDFWYDGDELVLTCPECNKFDTLEEWNSKSATVLEDEDFEMHDEELMVCPNCGTKMPLSDIIYDNTEVPEKKEESEGWDVEENQNISF